MALPKIDVPTYTITIPSTQKNITIRPFLVKEEKILLTAMAGEDPEEIANATKQIVNNCIVTPNVDVDKLEMFDLEYIILQLRIYSIGETAKIRFLPIENTECKECAKGREVEINLRDATVVSLDTHNKKIALTDSIGLILNYPTGKLLGKIEAAKVSNNIDDFFKIIWLCVEAVYDGETLTTAKSVSQKEGIEFLESLNSEQFAKIEAFFTSMPKLQQTIHIKCKECSFEQDFVLSGLENFFA